MAELELIWVIVIIIAFAVVVVGLYIKHRTDIQRLEAFHKDVQTKTIALGRNTVRGELNEILGTFKLLNDYEQLAIVTGATSPSLDLLGVKYDSLDFIEIKSLGTSLTKSEKTIRNLIQEHKVRYVVLEGNLPKSFEITERK